MGRRGWEPLLPKTHVDCMICDYGFLAMRWQRPCWKCNFAASLQLKTSWHLWHVLDVTWFLSGCVIRWRPHWWLLIRARPSHTPASGLLAGLVILQTHTGSGHCDSRWRMRITALSSPILSAFSSFFSFICFLFRAVFSRTWCWRASLSDHTLRQVS